MAIVTYGQNTHAFKVADGRVVRSPHVVQLSNLLIVAVIDRTDHSGVLV